MESTPGRNSEAERFGGREVDDELEFGRLHHRQVGGLGALEDAAGIDADLTKHFREVGSVAHQSAGFHRITGRISRRNPVARRQSGKLHAAADEEASPATKRASGRSRASAAKAASISPIVVALRIWICSPMVGAAFCTSRTVASATAALPGLTSTAIRTALGTSSCRSRSRFAATS